jgi:predicted anti-sigma-YlaC factor YlaD
MKCNDAERLIQRSLDGDLSPAERTALDAHMEGCASCRQAWDEYRALARTATRWVSAAASDPGDDFTMRVIQEIAALGETAEVAAPSRRSILAGFGAGTAVFAAAACVIALLGIGWHDLALSAPQLPSTGDALRSMSTPTWDSFRGSLGSFSADALQAQIGRFVAAGVSTWLVYVFVAALAGNALFAGSMLRRRRAM